MDRLERAAQLADEGKSNTEINEMLKVEFGTGISTGKLAELRANAPEREKRRVRESLEAAREERYAFVKQMLREGNKAFLCQQVCKEKFGTGVSYDTIRALSAELEGNPEGAIIPIELPPEILEDELCDFSLDDEPEETPADEPEETPADEPEETLEVPPPRLKDTLVNIREIQQWMYDISIESLVLTQDGKLSVLARHEFNIGRIK